MNWMNKVSISVFLFDCFYKYYFSDSSYVSISSPVIIDESLDTTGDLTEMWQRLSISLSSLGAPNNSDAETCRPADAEVEVEGETEEKDTDVELLDDTEGNDDAGVEIPEPEKEEVTVSSPQINENGKEEISAVTTENNQGILQEGKFILIDSCS